MTINPLKCRIIDIAKILCEKRMIVHLLKRRSGNGVKMKLISWRIPPRALGNIGRDTAGSSAYLICKAKTLF